MKLFLLKASRSNRCLWLSGIIIIGITLNGCVSNVTVKKPLSLEASNKQIPYSVGIFLSKSTVNKKIENKFINVWFGDILDRNIETALAQVYKKVQRVDSRDSFGNGIDKIAVVSFGPKTKNEAPMTVFGDLKLRTHVKCTVWNNDGTIYQEGEGLGEAQSSMGSTFFFGQIALYPIVEGIISASMTEALNDLVGSLLNPASLPQVN